MTAPPTAADTSFLGDLIRNREPAVAWFRAFKSDGHDLIVPAVSVYEIGNGLVRMGAGAGLTVLRGALAGADIVPFDAEAARLATRVQGPSMRPGNRLPDMDLTIASSAAAAGARRLVSRDRDFDDLAGPLGLEAVLY